MSKKKLNLGFVLLFVSFDARELSAFISGFGDFCFDYKQKMISSVTEHNISIPQLV